MSDRRLRELERNKTEDPQAYAAELQRTGEVDYAFQVLVDALILPPWWVKWLRDERVMAKPAQGRAQCQLGLARAATAIRSCCDSWINERHQDDCDNAICGRCGMSRRVHEQGAAEWYRQPCEQFTVEAGTAVVERYYLRATPLSVGAVDGSAFVSQDAKIKLPRGVRSELATLGLDPTHWTIEYILVAEHPGRVRLEIEGQTVVDLTATPGNVIQNAHEFTLTRRSAVTLSFTPDAAPRFPQVPEGMGDWIDMSVDLDNPPQELFGLAEEPF